MLYIQKNTCFILFKMNCQSENMARRPRSLQNSSCIIVLSQTEQNLIIIKAKVGSFWVFFFFLFLLYQCEQLVTADTSEGQRSVLLPLLEDHGLALLLNGDYGRGDLKDQGRKEFPYCRDDVLLRLLYQPFEDNENNIPDHSR